MPVPQHPAHGGGHVVQALHGQLVFKLGDDALPLVEKPEAAQGVQRAADVHGVPRPATGRGRVRLAQALGQERARQPARQRPESKQGAVGFREVLVASAQGFERIHIFLEGTRFAVPLSGFPQRDAGCGAFLRFSSKGYGLRCLSPGRPALPPPRFPAGGRFPPG